MLLLIGKRVTKGVRNLIFLPKQNCFVSQCRTKERALRVSHEHHFDFPESLPPDMVFRSDNGCNAQTRYQEEESQPLQKSMKMPRTHCSQSLEVLGSYRFLEPKHFGSHASFPRKSQSTCPFLPGPHVTSFTLGTDCSSRPETAGAGIGCLSEGGAAL